jgi:hypothetical protein
MTVEDRWVLLRPTWLYAAVLVALLQAVLIGFGVAIAMKHTSYAGWRE